MSIGGSGKCGLDAASSDRGGISSTAFAPKTVAVTLPDQRKGERIVLLTTQKDAERSAMQRQAKSAGASELAVPADIRVVDKVPLLGTGKTDYVGATALAKELAEKSAAASAQAETADEEPAAEPQQHVA